MSKESIKEFIDFMVKFGLDYLQVHRGLVKIICAKSPDQTYKLVWTDYSETLVTPLETYIIQQDWVITKVK